MGQTPTVYDVAARVGVSTATISRFFRAPSKVKAGTRDLIQAAVDELGYTPSGAARGLAEAQTGMVGLYSFSGHEPDEIEMQNLRDADVVEVRRDEEETPRLYPLFADEVLRGVELECTIRGIPLALGWQQAAEDGGVPIDEVARRVDGMIVLPHVMSQSSLRRLGRTKPIVMVSQLPEPGSTFGSVTANNAAGMRALTAHLVHDHHVRDFWFIGKTDDYDRSNRYAGFQEALKAAKIQPPAPGPVTTNSRAETRVAMSAVLDNASLPRAIVCSSDQTALGVLEALTDAGIRVPEDVIVTGYDGIDASRLSTPPLSTVRQPMDMLGRVAVDVLAGMLQHPSTPGEHRVLPVDMVLRGSCGC